MLAPMSQGRKIVIAVVAVSGVVIGVTIATYVINPFNAASDDRRAWGFVPRENGIGIVAED